MFRLLLLAGTVVCSSAFLDSLRGELNPNNCSYSSQFQCKDNRCIPVHSRCDGSNDCGDFSDEEDCDLILCREPSFFRCKNHRCIAKSFVCDHENDCEDFSDESDCEYFKLEHIAANTTCGVGEWQCTDKICIPEEWVCNQELDCLDGSDEGVGCSMKDHECDGFRCANNRCIPQEWRCDTHDDCSDGSDELDCEHHFDPTQCTLDQKKYLCLDGKACVDLKDVCNEKNNCLDKSDEGPLCNHSEVNCARLNCSHDCINLPTGPRCICPAGYHNAYERTCIDINECEEYGICDQKCRNTPGSYDCYCEHKYVLQDDKRTCKAIGGEATMIFSSKSQIRSYLLTSDLLFPVANNLKQVVGVSSDGHHIYWTDVQSEHETIVRALEDGSNREVIVTSGLGLPEDLEVDWLTGNIYFTDAQKQHIGVCKNDGSHCTVLINKDIRKPRAIALNVNDGTMYWTDWGKPSEIATALMDGSNAMPFLRDDVGWPNGLALDYPNSRLYWTDAKKMALESIRLDGTDRRVVLKDVVKHPFAITVFEDKLYWSDWSTHSIDSCEKFTGKNQHTLIKESKDYIYGMSIYHSALHQRIENPCALAFCSDICLLKGATYSCACSEGRLLNGDKHTCQAMEKKQMLVIAAKDALLSVEHKTLGKHSIIILPSVVTNAGALTYDSRNHSIFISDLAKSTIVEFNLHSRIHKALPINGLEQIVSMDYDPTGNNLYICDNAKSTLEVISLTTMAHKVLIHGADHEVPQSVALVPQDGLMFVSFYDKKKEQSHIDRMAMDGTGRTHIAEQSLIGPVMLHFDYHYHRLFFADAASGTIEHINVDGDERHLFKNTYSSFSDLSTLSSDLFWTNQFSKKLYWADKSSAENTQTITLDLPATDVNNVHVASVTPGVLPSSPCQHDNGNCSHLCLSSHKTVTCACPARMLLDHDKKHCSLRHECDSHEFMCSMSNTCIQSALKCNGKRDCPQGEDEEDCRKNTHCPIGYFGCHSGECIPEKQVCDYHFDCKDKSDEQQCLARSGLKKCPPHRFTCGDGSCIDDRFVCDGAADCPDRSDENNCLTNTCTASQFRCDSGECIPKSWECDHDYDCKDLSDEHAECDLLTCSPSMFACNNGKCIDKSMICDKSNDCGDRSDEVNCFLLSQSPECQEDQFACPKNQSICLSKEARCNGTAECPENEDEINCSNCGPDAFECGNKKCISNLWVCDGSDDCGDHSDENDTVCHSEAHKSSASSSFIHASCDDGFRCKSGACISLELLCNEKHDCFDESDEGGLCSKSCESMNNPCSQECIKTPAGPMCTCREGYKLMGDGHTCQDINECDQDPPICSQLCQNTEGSFTCDCFEGFSLRGDKQSCKSTGKPMALIYTIDNQIREIAQKDNSLKVLYAEEMPRITGLDVSYKNNYVVFAVENSPTIQRIDLHTMRRDYIEHIGYPKEIAYDWSTDNIYYYNAQPDAKSISLCSFSDMACAKLIDVDVHRHVSELVVDSVNRVMFYSLTSWWVFNSPTYVLYKANLDGTGITELVKSTNGFISGLTYDMNKKQVYYADQHQGKIIRATYEGKQQTVLFTNLTHPFSLKFFEDNLYFSTSNGFISKCQLYDSRSCKSFQISAQNYELFTVAQEGLQPKLNDPCQENTCTYMCVASSSHFKCICDDGTIVPEKKACTDNLGSTFKGKSVEFHSHDSLIEDENKGLSKTMILIILVTIYVAVMGVILIIYARRKPRTPFNLRMRFYNPTYRNQPAGMEKPILNPDQHEYVNPMPGDSAMKGNFTIDDHNITHLVDV